MSVHKQNGKWRVKWKINGQQQSRTFDRKGDADRFDAEVKRRKQLGPPLVAELDRSTMTLREYVDGPWRAHAATLAAPSRFKYAWALERHLADLVDEPLLALDVPRLVAHQRTLLDAGRTPNTVREAMMYLGGILQVAVEHGQISANPARGMRKVATDARDEVRPLAPVELERLIVGMQGRDRAVALLAGHLGLRPLEIRRAPWHAFDGRTLTVGRARTKRSAARTRVVDVPTVTASELKAWRLESGGRGGDPIIGPMTQNAMRLWRAGRSPSRARPPPAATT